MAEPTRYTYATGLSWGGDEPTAELEVEVSYTVAWGSPERGWSGPPENYDPGEPSYVEDIRVETIEGKPAAEYVRGEYMPGNTIDTIVAKLETQHEERMIEVATDLEVA